MKNQDQAARHASKKGQVGQPQNRRKSPASVAGETPKEISHGAKNAPAPAPSPEEIAERRKQIEAEEAWFKHYQAHPEKPFPVELPGAACRFWDDWTLLKYVCWVIDREKQLLHSLVLKENPKWHPMEDQDGRVGLGQVVEIANAFNRTKVSGQSEAPAELVLVDMAGALGWRRWKVRELLATVCLWLENAKEAICSAAAGLPMGRRLDLLEALEIAGQAVSIENGSDYHGERDFDGFTALERAAMACHLAFYMEQAKAA